MNAIEIVVVLLGFVALIAVVARRISVPYPILMVVGGLVVSFVPGFPRVELDPDLVLLLFLPPILYAAAYFGSPRELWQNRRPISLLAFGLVLATTLIVALVVTWLVPQMPFAAAVALGAIVSPPDAIAVTSIAQRLGLPRRLVTVLEGESLVNDATALVAYRFAVVATLSGTFSLGDAAVSFVGVVLGGILIGFVVGWVADALLERLQDPPVAVVVSIIAPFAAYLPAEEVHVSGVLAAVTAGLWHGWRAPRTMRSETRVAGGATWQTMLFVVNGLAFLLIGLQLPSVLESLAGRDPALLIGLAVAVSATVILVRLAWVFPATYIPRWIVPGLAKNDPAPPRAVVFVLGWAGMRGAISLAAALALPINPPFPERDLIVFLAFVTILVTLVGQGLTLPPLIRRLGVTGDDSVEYEELAAREAAAEAALRRLDLLATEVPGHLPLIDQLREHHRHRAEHHERLRADEALVPDEEEADHRKIRAAVLAAERSAVLGLWARGAIGEEALRRIERDIDLEELRGET